MTSSDTATTRDDVVDAVLAASRALVGVAARSLAAAPEEISLPQYRALVMLASHGRSRAQDLAALLEVTPSTGSRMVDRLVRKGLVRRRPVEGDRRAVDLEPTATGRALVDAVTQARRQEIARIVRRVPVSVRPELVAALHAFAEAAGEVPEQSWSQGWTE